MIDPTTPLKGARLAVVDCESTGLGPDGRVVEVAVVHLTLDADSVPVVAYTSRVNPGVPIPSSATEVHGITDADVADCPTWADVLPLVAEACRDRLIVAFNVPADHGFMVASGGAPDPWNEWLCLHVIARWLNTYEHGLGQVAARYRIALDAHGATGDAVTTALVARPLLRAWWAEWGANDLTAIGEVLEWQQRAALHAEAEFVGWLRRKNATGKRPDSPWHVLTGTPEPHWPEPPAPTWKVEKDGSVVPIPTEPPPPIPKLWPENLAEGLLPGQHTTPPELP